jgi:hypothetical protein
MAEKIFYNAFSNSSSPFGGWFICEWQGYEYSYKTEKPTIVSEYREVNGVLREVGTVSKNPDVQAFLNERKEAAMALAEEMREIANSLDMIAFQQPRPDIDGKECPAGMFKKYELIFLGEEDGKKLHDALIAKGWKKFLLGRNSNKA